MSVGTSTRKPLNVFSVAYAARYVFDPEESFLRVDEAWGEIELVVGAWGQAPKVRNVIARHAHLALAPVEPIAAFEISHEAPCVERFSSDTIKCLCVRRSRCGQDRQGIDAGAKT